MRIICALLLLSQLIHFSASAGDGIKRLLFISAGADYHLNKGDVTHNTTLSNPLRAGNAIGGRIGVELFWKLPGRLFFATGIDFKTVRQKLEIYYNAAEAGYKSSSVVYTDVIRYPNSYVDPFARMGYAFPMGKNNLDISLGLATSIPLSGQVEERITAVNITDPLYTDLAMYTNQNWGNHADVNFLPVNTLISLQLAYRLKLGKNQLRIGVDVSTGGSRKINRTEIYYFGPGRTYIGNSVFADRFQSVGIFAGISL